MKVKICHQERGFFNACYFKPSSCNIPILLQNPSLQFSCEPQDYLPEKIIEQNSFSREKKPFDHFPRNESENLPQLPLHLRYLTGPVPVLTDIGPLESHGESVTDSQGPTVSESRKPVCAGPSLQGARPGREA